MKISIRQVSAKEAASLLPLLRQGQDYHAERQPGVFRTDQDDASYTAFLEEWLTGEGVVALAAMSGTGEMLGCAVFEIEEIPVKPLLKPRRNGLLKHIVVEESRRGAGIESSLVSEVRARLRVARIDRLRAHHYAFNEASAAMLRKAGLARILSPSKGTPDTNGIIYRPQADLGLQCAHSACRNSPRRSRVTETAQSLEGSEPPAVRMRRR